jgi:3D (Asp-Asp-Asp) domain-containing protein
MKAVLTFLLLSCVTPCTFARNDSLLARVTVYWASGGSGSDHNTRNHRCATGERLRAGHCAVDPRRIPYGSRVLLPNGEALAAVDTGTAVKSRRAARLAGRNASEKGALVIDRFFETKGQALTWAATHPAFMPVQVVRPTLRAPAQQSFFPGVAQTSLRPAIPTANPKSNPTNSPILTASNSVDSSALDRLGRIGR